MKHSMDSLLNQGNQNPPQSQNQHSTFISAPVGGNGSMPSILSRGHYPHGFQNSDIRHTVPSSYLPGVAPGQSCPSFSGVIPGQSSFYSGVPQGQPPTFTPSLHPPYANQSPWTHPVMQNPSAHNSAMPQAFSSDCHEIPVFTFNQTVTLLREVWQASRTGIQDFSYDNRGRRRGQGRNRRTPFNRNYQKNNNRYNNNY